MTKGSLTKLGWQASEPQRSVVSPTMVGIRSLQGAQASCLLGKHSPIWLSPRPCKASVFIFEMKNRDMCSDQLRNVEKFLFVSVLPPGFPHMGLFAQNLMQ